MVRLLLAALAAATLALGAQPAAAQLREVGRFTGPWTTPGKVKVTFPDRIGDFRLEQVVEFSSKDWSAGYLLEQDGKRVNIVTVYVYARSRKQTCEGEVAVAEAAMEKVHPGMTRLSQGAANSPGGGSTGTAMQARYDLPPSTGAFSTAMASMLYLYCRPGSKWWVKVRSSWPPERDHERDVETILRAITWPEEVAE